MMISKLATAQIRSYQQRLMPLIDLIIVSAPPMAWHFVAVEGLVWCCDGLGNGGGDHYLSPVGPTMPLRPALSIQTITRLVLILLR